MKEFKGTPGSWQQSHREREDEMYATEVYCEKGETIATLSWYPKPRVDGVMGTYREANAQLIAAAPELLACLLECVNLPYTSGDVYSRAKQAIALAIGDEATEPTSR